jgi:hypothetical protein
MMTPFESTLEAIPRPNLSAQLVATVHTEPLHVAFGACEGRRIFVPHAHRTDVENRWAKDERELGVARDAFLQFG